MASKASIEIPADAKNLVDRPARLSTRIAAILVDQIVDGVFVPGASLPTEASLGASFSVSRPVVREAVKLVEQKGLIRVKQGEGSTVLPRPEWNLLDPDVLRACLRNDDDSRLRRDVVALRSGLEADMVRRAAAHLSPEDFARMALSLETMDVATEPHELYRADGDFHRTIHYASGNEIARTVVSSLVREVRGTNVLGDRGREIYAAANADHRRIYDHLQAGDAEAAALEMAKHISSRWLLSTPL
ncbi:DNA-binding FadR family transcriptional regulator [Microbacterium sp. BK668]|nr:DNA-binding FadR family transcriptional regulator [Microbacterium sp. BK668]